MRMSEPQDGTPRTGTPSTLGDVATDLGPTPTHDGDAESGGLRQAVSALRRRWMLALATFVILSALSGLYVVTTPSVFEATAVVAFQPRKGDVTGRDLAALLAQRYPELVASTDSVQAAAQASGVTAARLDAGLSAAIQPNNLNLILKVDLNNQAQALSATQSLYAYVLQAAKADPNLEAIPVSSPAVSNSPVGTSPTLLLVAALLLSAAVAIVFSLVWDRFSNR